MTYYNILTILSAILVFASLSLAILYLCDVVRDIFQPRRTPDRFPVRFYDERRV